MILIPFLITLSALMPYLPGNVRADQVIVPLLAAPVVLIARRHHTSSLLWILPLLASLVALAISSRLSWQTGLAANASFAFLRVALPVVAFMALPAIMSRVPHALTASAISVVACAGIASLIALAALVFPIVFEMLVYWVSTGNDSVWTQSRDVGRFAGIFNQPLEAGVFYSVALVALVYCWKQDLLPKTLMITLLALIITGGALSLSKNFIVVGIVVAAAYAIWTRVVPVWLVVAIATPIGIIVPSVFIRYNPDYVDSLVALYYTGGLFAALTAGRFGGEGSQVELLFKSLFEVGDWPLGRGLGSHLPLDNGFLEFFYQGGIVALGGFVVALLALLTYGWRHRSSDAGRLLIMLTVFIIGASLGGPAFTANRANIPLLLLMAAAIVELRAAASLRETSRTAPFDVSLPERWTPQGWSSKTVPVETRA